LTVNEHIGDYLSVITLCVKDLKSDRCRTQMAAARAVLEKSTMMLLTTTKVHSHYPLPLVDLVVFLIEPIVVYCYILCES